jgi:tRNA (mo5U34)-methyltransferase
MRTVQPYLLSGSLPTELAVLKRRNASKGDHAAYLKERIIALAPWHLEVQVTPEISTRVFLEGANAVDSGSDEPPPVSFISPREQWTGLMRRIYPNGLEGRTILDCACNCGGYSFWAKELGASKCFGFDVRKQWIDQANFLAEHRSWPSDGVDFEVLDLYDLPERRLEAFDIALFKGIFYHLPDPIRGMKGVADLTKELIVVDTAIRTDLPDGMLAASGESRSHPMSGVYGLNWFPTGPGVLSTILGWLGFPETRVIFWMKEQDPERAGFGRLQIAASRKEGLLGELTSNGAPGKYRA